MKMETFLARIRRLIQKDRLREAIKELEVALKGTHFHDEIIHQSSSFERLEKEKRQDIISDDKVRTESAKIREALLAILAELKEEYEVEKPFRKQLSKNLMNGRRLWLRILAVILLLVVGFIYFDRDNVSGGINHNEYPHEIDTRIYDGHQRILNFFDGTRVQVRVNNLDLEADKGDFKVFLIRKAGEKQEIFVRTNVSVQDGRQDFQYDGKAFSFVLTKVNRKFGFYSKTAHIQVTIHAGAKDGN